MPRDILNTLIVHFLYCLGFYTDRLPADEIQLEAILDGDP